MNSFFNSIFNLIPKPAAEPDVNPSTVSPASAKPASDEVHVDPKTNEPLLVQANREARAAAAAKIGIGDAVAPAPSPSPAAPSATSSSQPSALVMSTPPRASSASSPLDNSNVGTLDTPQKSPINPSGARDPCYVRVLKVDASDKNEPLSSLCYRCKRSECAVVFVAALSSKVEAANAIVGLA